MVDRTLRRWRDLRLAQCRRYLVGDSASVWATCLGLRVAGLSYRVTEPSFATLAHRHAVAAGAGPPGGPRSPPPLDL